MPDGLNVFAVSRERGVHALGVVTLSCLLCLVQARRNSASSVAMQWKRRKDANLGQRRTTSNACAAASAVSSPSTLHFHSSSPLHSPCSFTASCSPILPYFPVHSSSPYPSFQPLSFSLSLCLAAVFLPTPPSHPQLVFTYTLLLPSPFPLLPFHHYYPHPAGTSHAY